jgi:EAL domain-containing protein (putative c-di-GMP-specific phosphodiesterase class I)
MTRATTEAQVAHRPAERAFTVTRAGPPGIQRYAQTWSGDNTTSWKMLRWNIRMGLTMSLSGMFNTGHDVGGFFGPVPDAELLVRWVHPVHGPLAPSAFLPLAERERVIGDMTLYLLRHAATHCSEWRELGHGLTVSVNISANNLGDRTLLDALVEAAGVAAPSLLLEVTETDAMDDPAMIAKAVVKLRRRGIRISIDDFGTGHSSLTKLRLLKADEVKIDRSFVAGLVQSPSDQAIVLSTIQLAHAVGAHVTAEGIEDDATLEWLAQAGCDYGQGFGLARPMAPEEFARLLAERRA